MPVRLFEDEPIGRTPAFLIRNSKNLWIVFLKFDQKGEILKTVPHWKPIPQPFMKIFNKALTLL
jgi:hypothetical protein